MNDKHRLSSEQALDDYFFDLLIEPEEVESEEIDTTDVEPVQEQQPPLIDVGGGACSRT